jgi:hypothetical protein
VSRSGAHPTTVPRAAMAPLFQHCYRRFHQRGSRLHSIVRFGAGPAEGPGPDVRSIDPSRLPGDPAHRGGSGHPAGQSVSRSLEPPARKVTKVPTSPIILTSYVERQNLTLRMMCRRFTRLTNAFSKKLANLKAALALHLANYNFCRIHATLRVTPAMAAGITKRVWNLGDLL